MVRCFATFLIILFGTTATASVTFLEFGPVAILAAPTSQLELSSDASDDRSQLFTVSGGDDINLQKVLHGSEFVGYSDDPQKGRKLQVLCDCSTRLEVADGSFVLHVLSNSFERNSVDYDRSGAIDDVMGPIFTRSDLEESKGESSSPRPVEVGLGTGDVPLDSNVHEVTESLSSALVFAFYEEGGYDGGMELNLHSLDGVLKETNLVENDDRGEANIQYHDLNEVVHEHVAASFQGERSGNDCSSVESYNPANWVDSETALQSVSDILSSDEFTDDANHDQKKDLVVAYLSLGFGLEASRFVEFLETPAQSMAYKLLANIVDGFDASSGDLGNIWRPDLLASCGHLNIWKLLAGLPLNEDGVEVFRREFIDYPLAIQASLGARLASRLMSQDYYDAAYFVLAQTSGQADGELGERSMVEGQLMLSAGDESRALEVFEKLARQDVDVSVEALSELAKSGALAGSADVSEFAGRALELYADEYEGTERSATIAETQFLLELDNGDFDKAFTRLEKLENESVDIRPLLDKLATKILGLESDAAFAVAALRVPEQYLRNIEPGLYEDLVSRLNEIGFVAAAGTLVSLEARRSQERPDDLNSSSDTVDPLIPDDIDLASGGGSDATFDGHASTIGGQIDSANELLDEVSALMVEIEELGL